ncbi:Hsp70 family protein [Rhodococcus opacus]|uniref:Hsp70 family protein n=1 Tax=Rhodococcus opacus TaxID=37919 RepID=UPI00352DA347
MARGGPEELAAESIGTVLAERADTGPVSAVGVAYQDRAQAGAVRAALARQQLGNYLLVPEVPAALRTLEVSGVLADHATLVFYDLGGSGVTVTVVDRSTGMVLGTARSDRISGDHIDRLIREHHLDQTHTTRPADAAAQLALDTQCRHAKERLSTSGAVCVPGEGGLLLLSQDTFDALIAGPVETSAHLTGEVIGRSGRTPDAVVLIGGGARIPLIRSVMESRLGLPVIVPGQPELLTAEGAALLARPEVPAGDTGTAPLPSPAAPPPERTETTPETAAEEAGAPPGPRTGRRPQGRRWPREAQPTPIAPELASRYRHSVEWSDDHWQ